jgi:DivIVA domain
MLTPLEIENQKFAKQMVNGYSVSEVDDFLDRVTTDYENLYKENIELKDKLVALEQGVQHYKSIEETLQSTLLIAQSTAEDVKNVAHQKAEQILIDAQFNANKAVEELNQKMMIKISELENLQKQFDVYKAKMESLLISQLELLKEMNRNEE